MQGVSTTLSEINALKDLNGGALQIGISPFGGTAPAVKLLREFQTAYPNIKISLVEDSTEELVRRLLEDKLDLAFVMSSPLLPGSLKGMPLPRQELVAVCARRHPLRRQNTVSLEELAGEPLLMPLRDSYTEELYAALSETGREVGIAFAAGQVQTLKSLAGAGCGVAFLPEVLVEDDDALATVRLEPPFYFEPMLACRRTRQMSRAAEAFWSLAEKGVNEHA